MATVPAKTIRAALFSETSTSLTKQITSILLLLGMIPGVLPGVRKPIFLVQESSSPACPKDSAKNKGKKTTREFEDVFHITIFFIGLG
jgi:hypothetical protein